VESWGWNWNRSRTPKLPEVSSFEDLKHATELKQDEVIQERDSRIASDDASRPKFGRTLFPVQVGG
jgi:hypothetical protein